MQGLVENIVEKWDGYTYTRQERDSRKMEDACSGSSATTKQQKDPR